MKSLVLLLILAGNIAQAEPCAARGPNVVLFSMDGVREQEFFKGTPFLFRFKLPWREQGEIFKTFWKKHSLNGVVFGEKDRYLISSSVAISLPSYQALMTGHATRCRDNHCGQVQEETVFESVKKGLGLQPKDVAVFASWEGLKSAVVREGVEITRAIYPDIVSFPGDEFLMEIQKKAMSDLPEWKESRKDQYTFEMGLHYLRNYCPRLLYISLVDSDEYGHLNRYPDYVRSLRTYDGYIDTLIQTLKEMGEYGNQTTLFVTTDHSRGDGDKWTEHGYNDQVTKNVFLYARGPEVKHRGISKNSAVSGHVRPTIEYLMGLKPSGTVLPHFQSR